MSALYIMSITPNIVLEVPVILQRTVAITSFAVSITSLELFKSVTLCVFLYDNDRPVDTKVMVLKDDDYTAWNNDDQYIIDYVIRNLN